MVREHQATDAQLRIGESRRRTSRSESKSLPALLPAGILIQRHSYACTNLSMSHSPDGAFAQASSFRTFRKVASG
jgi:hypothetical protein